MFKFINAKWPKKKRERSKRAKILELFDFVMCDVFLDGNWTFLK